MPAGILLAAGRGARFGGAKLLAPLHEPAHGVPAGTPVGVAAALNLAAAMTPGGALSETLAVLRSGDAILAAQLRAVRMRIVECANADDGMGASLACGVAAAPGADGWIIVLADMPWIAPATIAAVAAAIAAGADIVAPAYRGERGHPVGFARRHRATLCALTGDSGARALIDAFRDRLVLIDTDDPQVVRDVDVPEDLRSARLGSDRA